MKVLITREIPQVGINILRQYPQLELDYRQGPPLSEEELKKAVKDADAYIPVIPDQVNKSILTAGKQLKVVATYSVGYDHIDLGTATSKGIYVGNTPGDLTESVAEHAIALMLGVAKHIAEGDKFCRSGKFQYWDPMLYMGPKLVGKTIGIVGFGRIGQMVGKIAKYGFNMNVIYNDVMKHAEAEGLLDAEKVDMDNLLENSDVVSLNCNLTDATHHLIGEDELKKMKPFAILINTSRGPIINEAALATGLKEGWIAGAGLDVFENEPEINAGLKKLNNVVLTPHTASATFEARIQMSRMVAENVVDVLINKKPPRYLVNKELTDNKVSSIV